MDWSKYGGQILFNVNENIPSEIFHPNSTIDIGVCKIPSRNGKYFLDNLSIIFGELTCWQDKTTLIGDFNVTTDNKNFEILIMLSTWNV